MVGLHNVVCVIVHVAEQTPEVKGPTNLLLQNNVNTID